MAAEEHGREILEVYLQAMRGGDWRAAEALMSRIYGKPTENVVAHTPATPERAVLKSMTLEEKLQLLCTLREGEGSPLGPILLRTKNESVVTPANVLQRNPRAHGCLPRQLYEEVVRSDVADERGRSSGG